MFLLFMEEIIFVNMSIKKIGKRIKLACNVTGLGCEQK